MTQRQLGEYVGMTSIHVNRTLRRLREAKMLVVEKGVVIMLDLDRLMRLASLWRDEAPVASAFVTGIQPLPGSVDSAASLAMEPAAPRRRLQI